MPYTGLFYHPIAAPLIHNPLGLVNPPVFPRINGESVYDSDSSEWSNFDTMSGSFTVDTVSSSTRCDSVEVNRLLEDGSTSPVPQFVEVPSVVEAVMQAEPLVGPLMNIGGAFGS